MSDLSGAIYALKNRQRQLDVDGIEVGVSRQAVDEVLDRIAELEACISEWLQYESDTSDCPNCEGCTDDEPCIFLVAAKLLKDQQR